MLLHRGDGGVLRACVPDNLRARGGKAMKDEVVRRYSGNPILTKDAIPYPVETVHNAAVVKHGGEYVMLFALICAPGGPSLVWRAAPTGSISPRIRNHFCGLRRRVPLPIMKSLA